MSQNTSGEVIPQALITNAIITTRAMIKLHTCRINFSSIIIGIFMAETNRRLNWDTKMIDEFRSYQDYLRTCSNMVSFPYDRVPCKVTEIEKMYKLVNLSLEKLDIQDHGVF